MSWRFVCVSVSRLGRYLFLTSDTLNYIIIGIFYLIGISPQNEGHVLGIVEEINLLKTCSIVFIFVQ